MDPINTYLRALASNLKQPGATEHTHRPALKALIDAREGGINAINEPKRSLCGAPDFEIRKAGVPIGHIEAKDVGRSLDEAQDSEQLKRYLPALSNLILTNYLEFRWFVDGKPRLSASLGTHIGQGKIRRDREGIKCVRELLENFLLQELPTIARADDLARRLAAMTRLIREVIRETLAQEKEGGSLGDQLKAFRDTLLPGLTRADFANMYAQTICYGLFSARVNATAGAAFSREKAPFLLPVSNPFLRRMFHHIAGPDLDDRVAHMVDSLVELLNHTDFSEVLRDFGHGGKEDPVFHFYETFLAAFDRKLRKSRGVFYTPDAVVSYIVRSVDYLLKTKFNKPDGLADPNVMILDPACGTGTFLYHVVKLIHERITMEKGLKGAWNSYVRDNLLSRIFGFELMMAPYTIAHMKLSHLLQETGYEFTDDERLEIYLTNTLEEAVHISEPLFARFIAEEANGAGRVKREEPIMVVLGNPPYLGHGANRSQHRIPDPNRPGKTRMVKTWIGNLIDDYFYVDGERLKERNPKWLQDDYVKFLRFGQWRIDQTGHGILAMITNHSYLDNPTFRGMRQQLMQTFDEIYCLDLHGNARKKEVCPDGSKDENVFDIQQGVGIAIMAKFPDKHNSA